MHRKGFKSKAQHRFEHIQVKATIEQVENADAAEKDARSGFNRGKKAHFGQSKTVLDVSKDQQTT